MCLDYYDKKCARVVENVGLSFFCRVQSVCRICLVTNRIESRKVNEINWNELTTEWPFGRKLRKLGTLEPFRAFLVVAIKIEKVSV